MDVEEGRENAENGVKKRYVKGRRKKGDMKSYERRRKEESGKGKKRPMKEEGGEEERGRRRRRKYNTTLEGKKIGRIKGRKE